MCDYLLVAVCCYLLFCYLDNLRPFTAASLSFIFPAIFWPATAIILVFYAIFVIVANRESQ